MRRLRMAGLAGRAWGAKDRAATEDCNYVLFTWAAPEIREQNRRATSRKLSRTTASILAARG